MNNDKNQQTVNVKTANVAGELVYQFRKQLWAYD